MAERSDRPAQRAVSRCSRSEPAFGSPLGASAAFAPSSPASASPRGRFFVVVFFFFVFAPAAAPLAASAAASSAALSAAASASASAREKTCSAAPN